MANNCLVTKLKGAVDYNNPDYFGQLIVNLTYNANADSHSRLLVLACAVGTKVELVGDSTFTAQIDGVQYQNVTEFTFPSLSEAYITLPNANAQFIIYDKYAIRQFENDLGSSHHVSIYSVPLEKFEYCTKLAKLKLRWSTSGNLSDVSLLTQLERLDIEASPIIGNYNEIAHLIKLTNATFSNAPDLSGTVESFASGQVSSGRTSGICLLYGPNLTYDGSAVSYKWIKYGSSMVNPTEAETAQGWQASDTQ